MRKILIVDDSSVDRSIISKIILKFIPDASIFQSENGFGVEDLILKEDIMLCILDLKMPGRGGLEILKSIKARPEIMDVPVIVCSAVLDTETLSDVLTHGAFDYFTKPLSEEVMKIALPLKVKNAVELQKRTKHIIALSQLDALTGLYNRNYFKQYILNENQMKIENAAILMADINGLKVVNDAFGSDYGDQVMIDFSKLIKEVLPQDAICARWGGDEFAIYLKGYGRNEAEALAGTFKKAFTDLNPTEINLSLAFGWEATQGHVMDLFKLLSTAEDAMIRSKVLETESTRSSMVVAILHTLHEKNPREEAHSRRVSELCYKLGQAMELSEKELHDLKIIGLLHDIGKIAIDENILNKPGKLVHDEWMEIKRHPEIGYRILSSAPEMRDYAHTIMCHHERIDGKGYPNGLAGEDIPVYAKMISIIDSFDAMTCERPYREPLSNDEAVEELKKHSGSQFDSKLVELFATYVVPNS